MGHRRRIAQAHQAAMLAATQMQLAHTQAQLAQAQQYNKGPPPPPPYPGFIGYPNVAQQITPPVQTVTTVVNHGNGICTVCRRKRMVPVGQSLMQLAASITRPFYRHHQHHHQHHYCHCR